MNLPAMFPYLKFEQRNNDHFYHTNRGWRQHFDINKPDLDKMTQDNNNEKVKQEYEAKYPNLFFGIYNGNIAIWVKRNNRDAEYIAEGCSDDYDFTSMNEEAGKALAPGMMFCSECKRATPRSPYFIFAGHYCEDCYNKSAEIRKAYKESQRPGFYD